MTRWRVAVTHPLLGSGGSEHVCLSIIEALQCDFDVTLVAGRSGREIDLDGLNEFCQTHVDRSRVAVLGVPLPRLAWRRFAALRAALFQRRCQSLAPGFDLMFSSYGAVDFGVPGIQFLHDPSFDASLLRELRQGCSGPSEALYLDSPARRLYLRLCRSVGGGIAGTLGRNVTLTNSDWTAARVERVFGLRPTVVHPPVRAEFPQVSWERRSGGFVCIGRWTPEKRMERVVEILAGVRQRGFDVDLRLVGHGGDPSYRRRLGEIQRKHSVWVKIHDDVASEEKTRLLSAQRYGISGRTNEPFGIAVAEMVKAGCIAFVPGGGGQAEIVDHAALTFANDDDAVSKIEAVLSSTALQATLRCHLSRQATKFSVDSFKKAIRQVVDNTLAAKPTAPSLA